MGVPKEMEEGWKIDIKKSNPYFLSLSFFRPFHLIPPRDDKGILASTHASSSKTEKCKREGEAVRIFPAKDIPPQCPYIGIAGEQPACHPLYGTAAHYSTAWYYARERKREEECVQKKDGREGERGCGSQRDGEKASPPLARRSWPPPPKRERRRRRRRRRLLFPLKSE